MTFRTIELRDANGDLVCEEPIHQPMGDDVEDFATFGGRLFQRFRDRNSGRCECPQCASSRDRLVYSEIPALRCGRAVITGGQIEGVEVERIVEAVGGSNAT